MVKDEDVCLHCGLCAERCPTGAWDMQKFLLADGACRAGVSRPAEVRQGGDGGLQQVMKRLEAINDFVVKFANVNGSGSASANELFAKAILRMGVPVSPRNIFPSNIQGLPTWYEVRVSERGWLGRRGGIDMMVAMNPQTWDADVRELEPGGYLFYDSTRPLPASAFRSDINVIGMPMTEICNATYSDPRQRQLFKNILYVGALAQLMGIDPAVIETLFSEQYKGKEKLLASNVQALHLGLDFAREHLTAQPVGLQVLRRDRVGNRIFIDGNAAAALGCVYGGATVCAWYPITPSSSVAEAFQGYCKKFRHDPDYRGRQVRHRAGRRRDRVDRHGHRGGLERRARLHHHFGPGREPDDRVHRPGLLRRDPGDDHQRAARRAVDRHAHAHPAGRPAELRLRLARRHQACAAAARRSEGMFRPRGGRARPGRSAADAGVRDDRPGHRHEPAPVPSLSSGTTRGASIAARC